MNLPTLKTKIAAGEIDTVITVFPDVLGGWWENGLRENSFVTRSLDMGTHGCNYLLTVNLEMDPMDGFSAGQLGQRVR